jgi:hypothetical protein
VLHALSRLPANRISRSIRVTDHLDPVNRLSGSLPHVHLAYGSLVCSSPSVWYLLPQFKIA